MRARRSKALTAADNARRTQQYGTAVLLVSAVLVKLIGALFKIPLSSAHCLGDEGFGYFSSAYDLFSPIYSLAMAGLPVAAAKTVSEHIAKGRYRDARASYRLIKRVFAVSGVIGTALFAALYVRVYAKLRGDGITEAMLRTAPEPQSSTRAFRKILVVTLPIALTSLTLNIPSMIDAFTVKSGLEGLINGGTDLRAYYADAFSGESLPELSVFPVLLYGIRGKAYTVFNLVPAITSVIGIGAVPAVTAAAASSNGEELKKGINTALKAAAIISLPAACGFMAIGGGITALLYDTQASAAIGGRLLTVYGFAALFAGFLAPLGGILQALGRQNAVLFNTAVGTAVKLAVNIAAVSAPQINVNGASLGTAACFFVIFVLDIISLIMAAGPVINVPGVFIKPLLSAALCGICARLVMTAGSSRGMTLIAVFCAGVVYFAALAVLKTLDESDFPESDKGKRLAEFCRKHRIIR